MSCRQCARRHDQTAIRHARERGDVALDLAGIAQIDRTDLHSERRRHRLDDANWPSPAAMAGSRRTATRVMLGAISFSSSSHFPPRLYSNCMKPVTLPPGRARLSTIQRRPGRGRSRTRSARCGSLAAPAQVDGAMSQDHVRRERDQFRRVSANLGGIARAQRVSIRTLRPIGPAQLRQPLQERSDASLNFRVVEAAGRACRCGARARAAARAPRAATPPRRRAAVMNSRRFTAVPRVLRQKG